MKCYSFNCLRLDKLPVAFVVEHLYAVFKK